MIAYRSVFVIITKKVVCVMKRRARIIGITVFACIIMGIVDSIIQPGYLVKSILKIMLFSLLPVLYALRHKECDLKGLFAFRKNGFYIAIALGVGVYTVILTAYILFRNVFDFSGLTSSLTASTGVSKENFLFVALYISFVNSFLEEFFFRGFSFLSLKECSNRNLAYTFSSAMFALYHIAMMVGWFSLPVVLLALLGLYIGGIIFNYINERFNTIYLSWLVHMFANFATNTIGYILFDA